MNSPIRRQRRRGAGLAVVRLIAIALCLLWVLCIPAGGLSGTETDPDDVPLRLDIKTVSHDNDASTITYTVETYESFPDNFADFRWGIDTDGDQDFDYFVSVEYDKKLIGTVDDAAENEVGNATVTRPSSNSVRVSFSSSVLGPVKSYGYSVRALSDLNDNGEAEAGEVDLAPDTGLYRHLLEAPASASAPAAPATPPPAATAPAAPSRVPVAEQGRDAAEVAPQPAPATSTAPPAVPEATPAAPRVRTRTAPAQQAGATEPTAMARTGAEEFWLALIGAGLLVLAVPCRAVARKRE